MPCWLTGLYRACNCFGSREQDSDRLSADINYIEDLIGNGNWSVHSGAIYRGDVLIGDGTQEKANFAPFLKHESKTGTLSYVFIKTGDEGLSIVESTATKKGYREGHFLRVAGSTKSPTGGSIVGTYIEKGVADILDKKDSYEGKANVAGGMIYCRYETLKNKSGETVGAVVVGRHIAELEQHIQKVSRIIFVSIAVTILLLGIILFLYIGRWLAMIRKIVGHLKILEKGDIPAVPLCSSTNDEMKTLVDGINLLSIALEEKEILRQKSEIDPLTGLANRFGLNRYFEATFEEIYNKSIPLSVGIIDIDFFKPFNDYYGHQKGDECIIMLADILKEMQREELIFCARFGGDEFLVICKDYTRRGIENIAKQIQDKVAARHMLHPCSQISNFVTISQGYSYGLPKRYTKLHDYILVADKAMYAVKRESKNNFAVYDLQGHGDESISCSQTL